MSYICKASGKFDKAKKYLQKLVSMGDESIGTEIALGSLSLEMNEFDQAKTHLETAFLKVSLLVWV